MPAHKKSWSDNLNDGDPGDPPHHHHAKQSRTEREPRYEDDEGERKREPGGEEEEEEEERGGVEEEDEEQPRNREEGGEDSEGSQSSIHEEKPEFISVELADIRKDVQCPICLGIIKKTRTVMECLHRFCRECIDKSMRLGNNECPACRTHCASRRSLRDDPNFDALIAALYPDIDKYEEEELAFHEEERTRNKQIQESIAQIFQRQSEALTKKRTLGNVNSARSQRGRNVRPRRRGCQGVEPQISEDNEDDNEDNGGKDSSSADERFTEVRKRRRKWNAVTRPSQPSSSAANSDGGCPENDVDLGRENRGISPGLVWNNEMLAWGRGGARSHTRHGGAGGSNSKNTRNTRLTKLVDYLRGLEESNDEFEVHLMLISLDEEKTPSLQQPHLCCRPSVSVKHLCEYVAHKTPLQAEEVEMLVVRRHTGGHESKATQPLISYRTIDPSKDELHVLEAKDTLSGIRGNCASKGDYLTLGYRRKEA